MAKRRSSTGHKNEVLERQIAEVRTVATGIRGLSVERVGRGDERGLGYRVFGWNDAGEHVDVFVRKKAAADAIRDVHGEVTDPVERGRRVDALVRWDREESERAQRPPGPRTTSAPRAYGDRSASQSPDEVARDVTRRAVRGVPPSGRFGPDKVFISAIYDRVAPTLGWSLDRFKRWLVSANREQIIDLARADAQGDMDSDLVERSEVRDLGASFHFVVDHDAKKSRLG
jgi:hypothetical protein